MLTAKEADRIQAESEVRLEEAAELPELPGFSMARAIAIAAAIFGTWQVVYHLVFMRGMPGGGMLASHLSDFLVEAAGAVLLAAYFIRVLNRQNARLKEKDQQKNLLVNALVHDLRQPLTGVRLSLTYMKEEGGCREDIRRMVDIALDSSAVLVEMVNDLLDVARLEEGQPIIKYSMISSAEFVAEGALLLRSTADARGQKLEISLPEEMAPVLGDRARLRRVVTNLVGNAVKHAGAGGTVTVAAMYDQGRARLQVSVADTGPGVPPELRHRIFDKYFRIKPERHAARTSAGLGLHFCKLIVEAHGGEIRLERNEGKGAVFTFFIPAGAGTLKEPS